MCKRLAMLQDLHGYNWYHDEIILISKTTHTQTQSVCKKKRATTYSAFSKMLSISIFVWDNSGLFQPLLFLIPALCFNTGTEHTCEANGSGMIPADRCAVNHWAVYAPGGSVNQYAVSSMSMSSENKASSYDVSTLLSRGPRCGLGICF